MSQKPDRNPLLPRLSVKSSSPPRDSNSGKMPPISAPAGITATFEEKRKNLTRRMRRARRVEERKSGENSVSEFPLGRLLTRKGSTTSSTISAPPRDLNSGKMPPISAPAGITATFEEKKRISRRERGVLGKGSPGKKSDSKFPFGATILKKGLHHIVNTLRASA